MRLGFIKEQLPQAAPAAFVPGAEGFSPTAAAWRLKTAGYGDKAQHPEGTRWAGPWGNNKFLNP